MSARPWHANYDNDVPTSIRYPKIPLHEMLDIPASAHPHKAATIFMGSEMSYKDLRSEVIRFANALQALGIKKGDRVALHLPNCPQYIIAYYGIMYCGGIVVNMNPLYTPDELHLIMDSVGVTSLITFDMVLPNVVPATEKMDLKNIIVTKVSDYINGVPCSTKSDLDLPDAWHHFSEIMEKASNLIRPKVPCHPDDPCLIIFTGGTTGIPKGAIHTHGTVTASTWQFATWAKGHDALYSVERRATLSVMPFFHSAGNNVLLNPSILKCSTQYLVPRFDIDEFIALLETIPEITSTMLVPTIVTAMLNHPKTKDLGLDEKIKYLGTGAAPMPLELIEQVKDLGITYSEGWGMTETASAGLANPVVGQKKVGTIGIPLPDIEYKLVDIETGTEEVGPGEPGELICTGPNIMKGYWNNEEETKNQLRDGWLFTGDIAVRDDEYYVSIVDRKKDMIIAGGYNIYPREIDEVLHQHPKVQQAVSVGIPDEYRGETVKAYIVVKEGETITEEEIITFSREHLASYKAPRAVEFRSELPQSAVGKILRKILRDEEMAKQKPSE